jgi:hypothetical protein
MSRSHLFILDLAIRFRFNTHVGIGARWTIEVYKRPGAGTNLFVDGKSKADGIVIIERLIRRPIGEYVISQKQR